MKKEIAILGSTGSIGQSLLNIISEDKKKFKIILLTANKNYKILINQAKKFNVKNIIVADKLNYLKAKKKLAKSNINIYNDFNHYNKIFKKKIDYVMSSIVGIDGLYPTFEIIKFTKKIAIANKESIICAWNIIKRELKKNKTAFIPVDSEHFSIWFGISNQLNNKIEKIYLTASGGSLLNVSPKKINKLSLNRILKHPNWEMGKKITIDSSTLMNKVFEVIETKKIFNINYQQIKIIIHENSYIHAILQFKNGMIKLVAHNTTMDIPIANTLFDKEHIYKKNSSISLKKLNNLTFQKVNHKKFPLVNIIKKLPNSDSLFETILVATNDELVDLFLKRKIKYSHIKSKLVENIEKKEFKRYKKILPRTISDVIKLSNQVRLKIRSTIN